MKERLKEIFPTIICFSIFIGLCFLLYRCKNSETKSYDTRVDDYPMKEDFKESNKSPECGYSDGSHSATVDYYNPETGHSATYSLEVQVEDCEVTTIYFPNGGWMDDSHISPTEIESDGSASIEDDKGRTFEVQIDN